MQEVNTLPPLEPGFLKWAYTAIGGLLIWCVRLLIKKHEKEVGDLHASIQTLEATTTSALAEKASIKEVDRMKAATETHRIEYRQDLMLLHTRIENMGAGLRETIDANGREAAARQAETLQAILKLKTN